MANLVLGGFDVVGDEDVYVGGRRKRRKGIKVPTPRWMRATTAQGVSRPEEEMDFLPFDPVLISAGGTTGVLIARPQRPFRGERLIMNASDENAADVAHAVVIDPAIYVGAVQVGASQGGTPITAFGAQAFGVRLSVPAAGQGTEIKIFVRLVGGALKVDVNVTATLIGRAMR